MFKLTNMAAVALAGIISAASLAPAIALSPPHLPSPNMGGPRIMVLPGTPRPGQPGPDPAVTFAKTATKSVSQGATMIRRGIR
jgi:hypothetical protein